MKVKGAELNLFLDEGWPQQDAWWEDHEEEFDSEPFDPDTVFDLTRAGVICFPMPGPDSHLRDGVKDFEKVFRAWRKSSKSTVLSVTVLKEDEDEFRALCRERKWTVTK